MALSRRAAAVSLAVVGVAGLTLASAAQLNVSSASLGAGQTVVASCTDETIAVAFTNSFASGSYATTAVTLSNVPQSCAGQALRVTLVDAGGNSLVELTNSAAVGSTSYTLPSAVSAAAVRGVAVVISG